MHIIKLNAIGSTNTFLKDLVRTSTVENYTVVSAESQFEGRGQMGSVWESQTGKNLIFSMFVEHDFFLLENAVCLNYAISLALYKVLKKNKISKLAVKWPNDILADSKKISGLLVENVICSTKIKYSIIGVGLNVNQEIFSDELKMATSIRNCIGKQVDKEILLKEILSEIKIELKNCVPENFLKLKERYLSVLYKYLVPVMFQKNDTTIFMGKIVGVSNKGDLEIQLEDESIQSFGLKEIKMLKKV